MLRASQPGEFVFVFETGLALQGAILYLNATVAVSFIDRSSIVGVVLYCTSFIRRLEEMLLQRIFYDEARGKRGSRERLFENIMRYDHVRPSAIRNWVNGVNGVARTTAFRHFDKVPTPVARTCQCNGRNSRQYSP